MVLEDEIKRYTEEKFNETFGNGQGTFDEFDWEDISTVIEDTARHFYSLRPHWKPSEEQMEALVSMLNIGSLSYPGQMQTLIELKNDLKKLGKTGREPIPGIKTIF